jgi:hypothetical protein
MCVIGTNVKVVFSLGQELWINSFTGEEMTHCGFSSRHCLNLPKVGPGHSYHELVDHVSLVSTPCIL